jgi:TolA-binding protein
MQNRLIGTGVGPVSTGPGGLKAALPAVVLAVALGCGMVHAEPAPKGDPAVLQTLRKAQGMLRQLSQEKADLEAKNAEQEKRIRSLEDQVRQLEKLEKQLPSLEEQARQQKAALDALHAQNASLQGRIGQDSERIAGLNERQRKTVAEMEKVKRDNLLLVGAVKERTEWIAACTDKNKALHQANREMLDRFGEKGFWDAVKTAEPFTGLAAVDQENAVQEFRFKLDDLQVTPWREPPQAAPAPTGGAEAPAPAAGPAEEDD